MRFLFFLDPSAGGLRPQAVGERTFSPVTTTTSGRAAGTTSAWPSAATAQSRPWTSALTRPAAPAGGFSLAFDGGLTLAYADADRTCYLTFTDDAMSGGRTSRYVKLDAPRRRLRAVGDAPAWGCKTLPVKNIFAWNVHFLPNVTF